MHTPTGNLDSESIGRYRLVKNLGQGAMARVYLAEYESGMSFKRMVALKVVRPEYARDDKFVQLMAREALIGSWLQHPNIVETLEFNQAEGRHYLALEYVEGDTLQELIEGAVAEGHTTIPAIVALDAMIQVCRGLGYAHSLRSPEGEALDIVHRDLKPANIMLSRHGVVKIMDFGIAKAKVAVAMLTAAGQVRGTPIYMAPEQVLGKPLDGRADQFAAGTVLHELITGRQVFLANNLVQIMTRVAKVDIGEAPDEAEAIVPGLKSILTRMWSKVPEERYPDCAVIATELDDLVIKLRRDERRAETGHLAEPGATLVSPAPALAAPSESAPKKKEKVAKLGPATPPPKAVPAKESRSSSLLNLVAGGFGLGRKKEPEATPVAPERAPARLSAAKPAPPPPAPSEPEITFAPATDSVGMAVRGPEPILLPEERPKAAESARARGAVALAPSPDPTEAPAPAAAAKAADPNEAPDMPADQDTGVGTTRIMKRPAGLPKRTPSLTKVPPVATIGPKVGKAPDPTPAQKDLTTVAWKGRPTAGLKVEGGGDDDGEEVDRGDDSFFFGDDP